jgi:hypothetical protein
MPGRWKNRLLALAIHYQAVVSASLESRAEKSAAKVVCPLFRFTVSDTGDKRQDNKNNIAPHPSAGSALRLQFRQQFALFLSLSTRWLVGRSVGWRDAAGVNKERKYL